MRDDRDDAGKRDRQQNREEKQLEVKRFLPDKDEIGKLVLRQLKVGMIAATFAYGYDLPA